MEFVTQIYILDKDVCVSLHTNAFKKVGIHLFSPSLGEGKGKSNLAVLRFKIELMLHRACSGGVGKKYGVKVSRPLTYPVRQHSSTGAAW